MNINTKWWSKHVLQKEKKQNAQLFLVDIWKLISVKLSAEWKSGETISFSVILSTGIFFTVKIGLFYSNNMINLSINLFFVRIHFFYPEILPFMHLRVGFIGYKWQGFLLLVFLVLFSYISTKYSPASKIGRKQFLKLKQQLSAHSQNRESMLLQLGVI